jgi:hypothetical protein
MQEQEPEEWELKRGRDEGLRGRNQGGWRTGGEMEEERRRKG